MNPIVFAMRRPLTVIVAVATVALGSLLAVSRMSIDIFPNLNLPVIYVSQPYGGMDPAQMEGLLTNYYEYHFLYINGIHHVESRNVQGMALMKLSFHPGTNMAQAMAETIGYVTRSRAFMPPGTVSPFITRFDVGSVPVGYLVLSSETRTIGEIQDQALFKVRPMFAALPGVSAPPPFGGSQRTVVVRLDLDKLRSLRMAPDEVTRALVSGNVISPSGTVRIDDRMPIVTVNTLVKDVSELLTIPIRQESAGTVYLRDVATVQDASDIPTGYALVNGRRAVYILVTKRADASTLSVVHNVRQAIPEMKAVLPDDIDVRFEFDQSPVVTGAVSSLLAESMLGAGLIGLTVLAFLRDWRSVLIVVLNIPFALAGALVALWLCGQSINLMTLGGLSLAVGILVDESTVEIENIHTKLDATDSVALAVRNGNLDTAVPRLLAMLCVVAVFLPSFFMQGAAQALFVPLSLAVGFAMIASYLLSSTFVPVMAAWLLKPRRAPGNGHAHRAGFDAARSRYTALSGRLVHARWPIVGVYLLIAVPIGLGVAGQARRVLAPELGPGPIDIPLGIEIFPKVDTGRFQVRLKAPTGTRIEATEAIVRQTLAVVRDETGDAVDVSVGYVGLIPSSYPINAIYQWTGGPEEAFLRVALRRSAGVDVEALKLRLRERLARERPEVRYSFEPADIVSDVMSFGSPTPIEVAIAGPNLAESREFAAKVRAELARAPGLRDLREGPSFDYPTVAVTIDRQRAGLAGVTPEEVARSLLTATSSSRFVVPNYWPDPKSGIGYQVQVEVPFQAMNSVETIAQVPVARVGGHEVLLRDVAELKKGTMPGGFDRYNMKRTVTMTANVSGTDLGRASAEVARAVARAGTPPKGVTKDIRGQVAPLQEIVGGLSFGLGLSVVAIVLLLTANFQSLRLALAAVATVPAVVAGVALALMATRTTLNLQSFNGTIMAVGVSVANAILLVSFAERGRLAGLSASDAAIRASGDRLRPILMTAGAMIAGMLPLALGLGEGGGQSAPLGRAVVGGLLASLLATLFVLPAVFALIQGSAERTSASLDPFDKESPRYVGQRVQAPGGDEPLETTHPAPERHSEDDPNRP